MLVIVTPSRTAVPPKCWIRMPGAGAEKLETPLLSQAVAFDQSKTPLDSNVRDLAPLRFDVVVVITLTD